MNIKKILNFILMFLFVVSFVEGGKRTRRGPDFLIIGAQRSGTTALLHYINQHPRVVKKMEEVHFFDHNFERGIEWYLDQFPARPRKKLVGDKSPYYLFHPLVPARVHTLFPKVKIIAILRDPVERAYSQYWMNRRDNTEELSFYDALNAEEARLKGEKEKMIQDPSYKSYNYPKFSYKARGIYVEQMRNWLKHFPHKQILVLSNEKLLKNPAKEMAKVFAFLRLPPFQGNLIPPKNGPKYPPMPLWIREELIEYFRPYNRKLEILLDMKFNWHKREFNATFRLPYINKKIVAN